MSAAVDSTYCGAPGWALCQPDRVAPSGGAAVLLRSKAIRANGLLPSTSTSGTCALQRLCGTR